jgi:hypothetical protein
LPHLARFAGTLRKGLRRRPCFVLRKRHPAEKGYWSRFAASGDPNIDDDTIVHWQMFREPSGEGRGANRHIVFDRVIRTDKRLREAACDFWQPYFFRTMVGRVPAWQ